MSSIIAIQGEASERRRVEALNWSHLSIEFGHLYMEDFAGGDAAIESYFKRLAPWVEVARNELAVTRRKPRVSTCFLIDDYFRDDYSPAQVIPAVLRAAAAVGVPIDYIARESGCAEADGIELAWLVQGQLVPDPPPGTNGTRTPLTQDGWLCNGIRSPGYPEGKAMAPKGEWRQPIENAARKHSVFLDVELRNGADEKLKWSCAFLAAVWQLVRLGLLRYDDKAVTKVVGIDAVLEDSSGNWPETWSDLPAVMQVNKSAASFFAHRTVSLMTNRFLPTEHAVRAILSSVRVDPAVAEKVSERAEDEGCRLPTEIVDRVSYLFLGL
ncbi:SCO2522 family protein [Cryptosporangium phraense]|uniref:Uncharacterized protein n=1 Tax=Cryptosporangium phraense TaxID=2593070 RepID=A0A545AW22_9ACTN|nr:SCO2522 family protein [Cryptosporangium phraense]TQS45539.1 hypothetical protein FL583_07315 [Cryptosporangium phraense]